MTPSNRVDLPGTEIGKSPTLEQISCSNWDKLFII